MRAGRPGLENFGWDAYEGTLAGTCPSGGRRGPGDLIRPIHQYSHSNGCSVTGGFVYRGRVTEARGRYFFGDFCSGAIWSFRRVNGVKRGFRREPFTVPGLSSFGEGRGGGVYLVSLYSGTLYRIAAG